MSPEMFDAYYKKWASHVRREAERITHGDADVADDLAQEAWVKLAQFDPSAITTNEEACIWRVLRDHMRSVYRSERRARVIGRRRTHVTRRRRRMRVAPRRTSQHPRRRVEAAPQHLHAAPRDLDEGEDVWGVP